MADVVVKARLRPEIPIDGQQEHAERGQTEPCHERGPRVLDRVRGDDEGGDSGQDTGDEAAPCEGSHQRSASGGVPTTRYIQTAPSRKKPVVDAAKQSR